MSRLRLLTWNVNSIRQRLDHVRAVVAHLDPDVLCLQETKISRDAFPRKDLAAMGYAYEAVTDGRGHAGVAILSRQPLAGEPVTLTWAERDDHRHIAAPIQAGEGPPIWVHNFYIPAGGDEPDPETNEKYAHKLTFVDEMARHWRHQPPARTVIAGDFNIAPLERDVWSHRQLLNVISHTPAETDRLIAMQEAGGFTDLLRAVYPADQSLFTWWSYRNRTWPGSNRGRRLDHIWATADLAPHLSRADVWSAPRGWTKPSDHVPVWAELAAEGGSAL